MSTTENRNSDLITTTQAGRLLGVTKHTIIRMVERGELPAVKISAQLRIRTADVEAYLVAARVVPTEPRRQNRAPKGAK